MTFHDYVRYRTLRDRNSPIIDPITAKYGSEYSRVFYELYDDVYGDIYDDLFGWRLRRDFLEDDDLVFASLGFGLLAFALLALFAVPAVLVYSRAASGNLDVVWMLWQRVSRSVCLRTSS